MLLGGAGHAQRVTSPSGVELRVDRQLSVGFDSVLRHEVQPENLLNSSIEASGGKEIE